MGLLFSTQFIIMALFINVIIFLIFNGIKDILTKSKGENPEKGLPEIIVRNLMMISVFIIAFLLTWLLVGLGQVTLILDSIFLTSAWCATLSTITYNVGIKDIMKWFAEILKNKINGNQQ
jgi:glucan phosphoethanolaminetransferase (alkaline phosphatase superfamily)